MPVQNPRHLAGHAAFLLLMGSAASASAQTADTEQTQTTEQVTEGSAAEVQAPASSRRVQEQRLKADQQRQVREVDQKDTHR